MYTAKLKWPVPANTDPDQVAGLLANQHAAWRQCGQLIGEWHTAEVRGGFESYVVLPERDSLDSEFASQYVTAAGEMLAAAGVSGPEIEIIGVDRHRKRSCACTEPSGLVLFTTCVETDSPVSCLDCSGVIPVYRLQGASYEEVRGLLVWQENFKALDTLYMNSGVGETFGLEQLFLHDSALSREGRGLAGRVEVQAKTPTFYYLCEGYDDLGFERGDECTSCGESWVVEEVGPDGFQLRCDPCRLVSHTTTC